MNGGSAPGAVDLMVERLQLKLLAGAAISADQALREALCQVPDRALVRALVADAAAALAEFLEEYEANDSGEPGS